MQNDTMQKTAQIALLIKKLTCLKQGRYALFTKQGRLHQL